MALCRWAASVDVGLRAALGSVLYLVLIALLYLAPSLAHAVTDPVRRHMQQIAHDRRARHPSHHRARPIAPWAGLSVLTARAVRALLIGGLLLQLRDA